MFEDTHFLYFTRYGILAFHHVTPVSACNLRYEYSSGEPHPERFVYDGGPLVGPSGPTLQLRSDPLREPACFLRRRRLKKEKNTYCGRPRMLLGHLSRGSLQIRSRPEDNLRAPSTVVGYFERLVVFDTLATSRCVLPKGGHRQKYNEASPTPNAINNSENLLSLLHTMLVQSIVAAHSITQQVAERAPNFRS